MFQLVPPAQGSATSIRTPSLKRGGTRGRAARGGLLGEALGEDSAVLQPYVPHQHTSAGGSGEGGEARSLSVASSGGSLRGASWLGALGSRVAGALHLHRRGGGPGSLGPSEMGSPRSGGSSCCPAGLVPRAAVGPRAPALAPTRAPAASRHRPGPPSHPTHPPLQPPTCCR